MTAFEASYIGWSLVCIILGLYAELRDGPGSWKTVISTLIIIAPLSVIMMVASESYRFGLGIIAYALGIAIVMIADVLDIDLTRKK